MIKYYTLLLIFTSCFFSCGESEAPNSNDILGFELLNDINGHWVGTNNTSFGFYDWFAFDFRPISSSHSHSIYEGGTNQNIINSVFIADLNGQQKIMARNGGWLGTQYRATYFVLDQANTDQNERYYRLADAVGGEDRAYIEFRFKQDSLLFDAYKDNSGFLDKPILHMSFKGSNRNEAYAQTAKAAFNFPSTDSEVIFNNAFENLVDPDSALFLEEANDPFPKSDHGHISDLKVDIIRNSQTMDQNLLLFISKKELVSSSGLANNLNIENSVIRTISVQNSENNYVATYLHPDDYYITVFADADNNAFPSTGDYSSASIRKKVNPEMLENIEITPSLSIQ